MSLSRWIGLSEGKDAILLDRALQPFFLDWLGDEVDVTCEYGLEPATQPVEPSEIRKPAAARVIRQPNDNVDVGIRTFLATGD